MSYCSLLAVIYSLLLAFAVASPVSKAPSLKRKFTDAENEADTSNTISATTSTASITNSESTMLVSGPVIRSPWIVDDRFDLHPTGLPQSSVDVAVYRSLFKAMGRRDFETTCLILSLFPGVKMTRYFLELTKECYMNFYQLALIRFPFEEFETIVSFGKEDDLIIPYGKGSTILDLANVIRDEQKIAYLRSIFVAHFQMAKSLKERVKNHGLISLFNH